MAGGIQTSSTLPAQGALVPATGHLPLAGRRRCGRRRARGDLRMRPSVQEVLVHSAGRERAAF
eukprot:363917-Chlamydomonas_euryale.AAC.6